MSTGKKRTIIKILYCVYLVALVCFIFSNSMASKTESAGVSMGILSAINNLIKSIGIPFEFSHSFIRKLAHVIEFMTLGISLFGFLGINKKINIRNCIYSAFFACIVAMTDEMIQYFYERGSMVTDVWLDFLSAVAGILIAYIFYRFILSKKKKI